MQPDPPATPGALQSLARLRAGLHDTIAVGVGSVITARQAVASLEAGADFLVSPGVCAEVAREEVRNGVACYPGGWTPAEIIAAWGLGVPAVKLFSAAFAGTVAGDWEGLPDRRALALLSAPEPVIR